jgi:hypothetical protein
MNISTFRHKSTRIICAIALVPLMLWPSFASTGCCCVEMERELKILGLSSEAQDALAISSPVPVREMHACPKCRAAAIGPESDARRLPVSCLQSICECETQALAILLPTRSEASRSETFSYSIPPNCCASRRSERLRPSAVLVAPTHLATAQQHCAIVCRWLI